MTSPNKIWVQVVCSKYGFEPNSQAPTLPTRYGSYLWKALGKVWHKVVGGLRWNVGTGVRVRFWWDISALEMPLYALSIAEIPEVLINSPVAAFVTPSGSWNWSLFYSLLPHHVLRKIAAIKPPESDSTSDQFYWAFSSSGSFTVRSAYQHLYHNSLNSLNVQDSNWNLIWKWRGPQRIRTFTLLAAQERLKCKAELLSRHIISDADCPCCNVHIEDAIHVLRDCVTARRIWRVLRPGNIHDNFFNLPLREWIMMNLKIITIGMVHVFGRAILGGPFENFGFGAINKYTKVLPSVLILCAWTS